MTYFANTDKMTEFNLSEKIRYGELDSYAISKDWIQITDVKEFIKRLKEEIENEEFTYTDDLDRLFPIIDKLAGDKLHG